jgi:anaphase-promoting complex subunit 7
MLVLYYKESCPFCQRVLQMAENLKVDLELKDVSEDETALAELIEKGGEKQVPFLVDTEKDISMYESNDIIDYVRENYANTKGESAETKPKIHVGGSTCESCEG